MLYLLRLSLLLAFFGVPTGSFAFEISNSGKAKIFVKQFDRFSDASALDIEYEWKLWTLFGDPVQFARFKWDFAQAADFISIYDKDKDGRKYQVARIFHSDVPHEILEQVRLYDVVLAPSLEINPDVTCVNYLGNGSHNLTFRHSRPLTLVDPPSICGRTHLRIGAGVVDVAGGKWSFNLPESPDWAETFQAGKFINEINHGWADLDIVEAILKDKNISIVLVDRI